MGLTVGDYWYPGDVPDVGLVRIITKQLLVEHKESAATLDALELLVLMQRVQQLTDQLYRISIAYATDNDNNGGDALQRAVEEYEKLSTKE